MRQGGHGLAGVEGQPKLCSWRAFALAAGARTDNSLRVARVGGAGAPWRRAALEAGAREATAAA